MLLWSFNHIINSFLMHLLNTHCMSSVVTQTWPLPWWHLGKLCWTSLSCAWSSRLRQQPPSPFKGSQGAPWDLITVGTGWGWRAICYHYCAFVHYCIQLYYQHGITLKRNCEYFRRVKVKYNEWSHSFRWLDDSRPFMESTELKTPPNKHSRHNHIKIN